MMSEEKTLAETKEKPKKLWDGALKIVKGENDSGCGRPV